MNDVLQKKANLMVYLAKADGPFHMSEKKFLRELFSKNGVNNFDLQSTDGRTDVFNDASSIHSFCKKLAKKIKFLPDIIDAFTLKYLTPLHDFRTQTVQFKVQ